MHGESRGPDTWLASPGSSGVHVAAICIVFDRCFLNFVFVLAFRGFNFFSINRKGAHSVLVSFKKKDYYLTYIYIYIVQYIT